MDTASRYNSNPLGAIICELPERAAKAEGWALLRWLFFLALLLASCAAAGQVSTTASFLLLGGVVRNSLAVYLIHGWQVITGVLAALVTLVNADGLVEGQELLLVFDVEVLLLLEFVAEGADQLRHPHDNLVVLIIGLQQF